MRDLDFTHKMLKKLPIEDEGYQTRSDRLASFGFEDVEETVRDLSKSKTFLESALDLTQSLASLLTRGSTPEVDTALTYSSSGLMHVGTIYMGSNKQQLDVVFDTGSSYLVLESIYCKSCLSTRFDYTSSTTYEQISKRPMA